MNRDFSYPLIAAPRRCRALSNLCPDQVATPLTAKRKAHIRCVKQR